MGKGAAVRSARVRGQHVSLIMFHCTARAHPAQGVAITTAAVHGTQERSRLFRRVLDEGACEKVELCRQCAHKDFLENRSS